MASTKKATRSFKDKWEEDLKWPFIRWALATPPIVLTIALGITTINLFTNWF